MALFATTLATATVSAATGTDQATAYQANASHDGTQTDVLATPLTKAWSATFAGPVSYPLVAGGMAYVTAVTTPGSYGTTLYALNLSTGAVVWSANLGGIYFWSAIAYDNSQVYSVNYSGRMTAFNATTGHQNWSVQLPGQSSFTSAPTAANGFVYTSGAGSGGTVYAVDENTGSVAWTASVMNGDESSPVVTSSGVYVSYACEQAYDFNPTNGFLVWHHSSSCEGGGGRTPVLANGDLYVRDNVLGNVTLDASSGAPVGSFSAGPIPAVTSTTGYFTSSGTLSAENLSSGTTSWNVTGDGSLSSAPLVANGVVYVGSTQGDLYALSGSSGAQLWSANVGSPIAAPDEQNVSQPLTGMAIGAGMLLVSATDSLVAYQSTPPAFSFSASPSSLQVRRNHTASSTISVSANVSFSGTVTLTASAPASVRTQLSQSSVTLAPNGTATSKLTLTPTARGTFTVTVQGCSSGTCHSVPVTLTTP